jgi:hypothetical protein
LRQEKEEAEAKQKAALEAANSTSDTKKDKNDDPEPDSEPGGSLQSSTCGSADLKSALNSTEDKQKMQVAHKKKRASKKQECKIEKEVKEALEICNDGMSTITSNFGIQASKSEDSESKTLGDSAWSNETKDLKYTDAESSVYHFLLIQYYYASCVCDIFCNRFFYDFCF